MLKWLFSNKKSNRPYKNTSRAPDLSGCSGVISGNLDTDLPYFQNVFDRASDVIFKELMVCGKYRGCIIFVDGIIDVSLVDKHVISPLLDGQNALDSSPEQPRSHNLQAMLEKRVVSACQTTLESDLQAVAAAIAGGETALILEGASHALLFAMKDRDARSVEEAPSEPTVRGPREGFTEKLRTNTALLRSRLKTTRLKLEPLTVGEISHTEVLIVYLDGVVKEELLEEVRRRLGTIKMNGVLESGYIEEWIEDKTFSPFPQMLSTERPDRVAAALMEGKVAIMIDNTPFVLVLPISLLGLLQSPEDYYQRYLFSTATRWLRYWLAFIALTLPSLYIAVTTFHQEMVPTNLLLSIASSREAVPFPAIVEVLLMEITFEGLREAGIRMPRPVGQAVSIVGALVIGQAAVQAGIVSAILVIIVSFTGIASFIFPAYSLGIAARLLRFPLMCLAGTLGLYGIFLGLLVICIHLLRLRSFGEPYLVPVSPLSFSRLKDTLIRAPWRTLALRRKGSPE